MRRIQPLAICQFLSCSLIFALSLSLSLAGSATAYGVRSDRWRRKKMPFAKKSWWSLEIQCFATLAGTAPASGPARPD